MGTYHFVAVVDGKDKLLEVPPSIRLWQTATPGYKLVQVAAGCIFHGNCKVVTCEEHLPSKHTGQAMLQACHRKTTVLGSQLPARSGKVCKLLLAPG